MMLIANLFDVQVPLNVKNEELRLLLMENLGKKDLFAGMSTAEGVGKPGVELRDPEPSITHAPSHTLPQILPSSLARDVGQGAPADTLHQGDGGEKLGARGRGYAPSGESFRAGTPAWCRSPFTCHSINPALSR